MGQHVRDSVPNTAGASARREYERRKARDEARTRERWGRLGDVAIALSEERQSTTAWRTGAVGEERVAAALERISPGEVVLLHDRRVPGSRANIDHIVVTRAGLWVIDAKRYKGRPTLRVEGGFLRPRTEKLIVGGRDRSKLVDGMLEQVGLVQPVAGEAPVRGVLCFVEADWPLVGGSFQTRGVHVVWPKKLVRQIERAADASVDVHAVAASVAAHFPPA